MSEASVVPNRFWGEFSADVAKTLSTEQRKEIERVVGKSAAPADREISDLRLSFKWFFVRLAWGPEKRSPERVKQEQRMHPVMARRNLPTLASLFAGWMVFWLLVVAVLTWAFINFML